MLEKRICATALREFRFSTAQKSIHGILRTLLVIIVLSTFATPVFAETFRYCPDCPKMYVEEKILEEITIGVVPQFNEDGTTKLLIASGEGASTEIAICQVFEKLASYMTTELKKGELDEYMKTIPKRVLDDYKKTIPEKPEHEKIKDINGNEVGVDVWGIPSDRIELISKMVFPNGIIFTNYSISNTINIDYYTSDYTNFSTTIKKNGVFLRCVDALSSIGMTDSTGNTTGTVFEQTKIEKSSDSNDINLPGLESDKIAVLKYGTVLFDGEIRIFLQIGMLL